MVHVSPTSRMHVLFSVESHDKLGMNICDSLRHPCLCQSAAASVQKTTNFLSVELNRHYDYRIKTDSSIFS